MSKYKIKDLAVEISQRIDSPKTSGYDKFVGLEHYDSGEVRISRFGRTDNLDSSVKEFKSGDILIARRNVYLKRAGLVDFDGVTSGDSIVIRAKNDINKRLLPFVFNTKEFWDFANQFADGSMSKRLSPKLLMEYETALPDTEEEKIKLADLLWSVFDTAMSYKEMIKQSDELVQSRFVEMFGDIFNGKSNYSTIKISEAVVPKIERAKKDFNADDEIKYLDISSVDNRKNIIIGYTDYLMKDAPSRAQQHVRKDDIVISTVRPNLNNVAKVTHDYSNIVASSGFCVLRASKVEPNFLFALVSMQSFADYLASLTTGANYPAVSDKDILNFEIPNAPFEEQTKFSDFIKQVDKLKFNLQEGIEKLEAVNKKIMNQYLKKGD